jgi:hypothetical protein
LEISDLGFEMQIRPTFKIHPGKECIFTDLRGFSLPTDLFLDSPVREQIFMAATRALPGTFDRVGAPLVEHLHD